MSLSTLTDHPPKDLQWERRRVVYCLVNSEKPSVSEGVKGPLACPQGGDLHRAILFVSTDHEVGSLLSCARQNQGSRDISLSARAGCLGRIDDSAEAEACPPAPGVIATGTRKDTSLLGKEIDCGVAR